MLRQAARHPRLRRAVRGAIERLAIGRQAVVGAARGIEGLIVRADRVRDAARRRPRYSSRA